MPSLGVSSLDLRPPQGGLLFGQCPVRVRPTPARAPGCFSLRLLPTAPQACELSSRWGNNPICKVRFCAPFMPFVAPLTRPVLECASLFQEEE